MVLIESGLWIREVQIIRPTMVLVESGLWIQGSPDNVVKTTNGSYRKWSLNKGSPDNKTNNGSCRKWSLNTGKSW